MGLMSLTDLMRISTTYHLPHDHSVHKERVIGQLSVSILLARNLKPSKNLNRKLRSTYVVVKYPSQSPVKTPVVPNTLSPSFRNATFSFTVNSTQLGKFLTISLYDRRSFFLSPDKLLGSIEIDISVRLGVLNLAVLGRLILALAVDSQWFRARKNNGVHHGNQEVDQTASGWQSRTRRRTSRQALVLTHRQGIGPCVVS